MANAKSNTSVVAQPSREEYVREYMAQLTERKPRKASITERIVGWAEDRVVSGVKNSKRTSGRITAAWEIADQLADVAYAEEHARHAEEMADRLGLK